MRILCFLFFGVFVNKCVVAQAGTVNTIAGNGTMGFSGDGGPAIQCSFSRPWSIAQDTLGNLYVADQLNGRVRKIDSFTGDVYTVAGDGSVGSGGDGGLATDAQLNDVKGVDVDTLGNLYIAERLGSRIRKVDVQTGIISTVVGSIGGGYAGDGGQASTAAIKWPMDVTYDKYRHCIYIADWNNNRVRKVDLTTNIISTIAGNGVQGSSGDGGPATSAQLYGPEGVIADSLGNIYISCDDNRIRKVDFASGIISTFAGTGAQGYSGDGGPAASATFYVPYQMAFDRMHRNLYVPDVGNHVIRKIDMITGIITTVAGTGTGGFSGDGGDPLLAEFYGPRSVCLDKTDNLYIADTWNNHRIRKVSYSTGVTGIVSDVRVTIFPNPAYSHMTVVSREVPYTGTISDLQGTRLLDFTSDVLEARIDLTTLASGVYTISVKTTSTVYHQKVIITH